MKPLFSCVVPVKGPRPFMEAALESLRFDVQGLASPDELEVIIQDADVEPDKGQSDAINKGFAKARGEWLFWLNADDVLLPGALKKVKAVIRSWSEKLELDSNSCAWIAGNTVEIDAEGRGIRCLWDRGRKAAYKGLPVRVYGPSSFIRRDMWEQMGGLDESLRICMDTDLWCKLRANGHWFKKVPDYLWGFRVHDGSTTRSATRSDEELSRQRREVEMVHARYGVRDSFLRNLWLRVNRLVDGGYLKSWRDTRRLRRLRGWKFCWWTVFPNTYMKELFDGLRGIGLDVQVCYFGRYDAGRVAMGWRERELESWEHRVQGIGEARRVIKDFDERVQMVPSFFNLTSWKLILRCTLKGLPWFSITEGTRGRWMTRPLFRAFCWFVNRYALKLFVEGGPRTRQQFIDAGVVPAKIVPFSYATMKFDVAGLKFDVDGGVKRQTSNLKLQTSNLKPQTVFVYAGSFCERKATDVLLAAWERLHRESPAAKLILAGGGEWRTRVEAVAGEASGIEYVGAVQQEKIYEVICRGDVMLLPSRYDPWGVALVEGGMAGLAMVGSDRTGAAEELVRDGENGYVVKSGDEEDLLRVMRIYAADREVARQHGAAARIAAERTSGESLARVLAKELGIRLGGNDDST